MEIQEYDFMVKKMRLELHKQTKQGEPVDIVVKYTYKGDEKKIKKFLQEIEDELEGEEKCS